MTAAALDRTLQALADPTRRGVVELLRGRPRRAGELASALRTSPPALSRHLRLLRQTGLVEEEPLPGDARVRVLRLRPEPLAELRAWLEEVERFWAVQLASFKAHAEAAGPAPARPRRRR
ncbi:MAG: winged helix-turn-helix transcriptional regulator [Deltaproteobacteria bacterium]|nr:winged helix-turn-helix transcriptional regulator [Deltaproteobacteria bacterium]